MGRVDRSALRDRGKGTDDDIVDSVAVEHREDLLSRELGSLHPFLVAAN